MIFIPHIAITDQPLEEAEVIFIMALVAAAVIIHVYVSKLRNELRRQKQMLKEQSEFNNKLNATVDRILQIEQEGGIDSSHQKR